MTIVCNPPYPPSIPSSAGVGCFPPPCWRSPTPRFNYTTTRSNEATPSAYLRPAVHSDDANSADDHPSHVPWGFVSLLTKAATIEQQ
ncbi:hypothetical protein CDAR_12911 [Caerostris darwini]|uniref:Uncharacterized protein n=1 Tax=Caerostris darwini TaxID=1538125 RepID=A0AAV4SI43_9ARAC|nr:hypothetical protein CDAR_12911 [Caerostris darwini]